MSYGIDDITEEQLDEIVAEKSWRKEFLAAIKSISKKETNSDNSLLIEVKELMQKVFTKLSEPVIQKEIPAPQVNITNDNKEVSKILNEFKDEIKELKSEIGKMREDFITELSKPKNFDFEFQRTILGDIQSPIKARQKK